MTNAPPGWLSDPTGRHQHRYWDGSKWTDQVADDGVSATDPVTPTSSAEAASAQPGQPTQSAQASQAAPTNLTPPGDTPEPAPPTTPQPTTPQPQPTQQQQPPQPTPVPGPGGWSPPSGGPGASPSGSGPSTPLLVVLAGVVVALFAAIVFVLMDDGDGEEETTADSTTTTEPTTDESTTTTTGDATSTTIGDDAMGMDAAAQQLSTEFDITEDEARCMIGEAAAWMVSNDVEPSADFTFDELTGEQQADVFSAMLTCVDPDDLVSNLIATSLEGVYTADEAECIGDAVVANIDAEDLMAGAFTNPDDPVSELSSEDQASFQDAVEQCTT